MDNFSDFILFEEINDLIDQILNELGEPDSFRDSRLKKNVILNPNTNSPWRANDRIQQVKEIVKYETKVNKTPLNQIWVNFSDTLKFGQRMKISNGKSTPVGIFGFPVDYFLKNPGLEFSDRRYLNVFKTKNHLEVGESANEKKSFYQILKKYPALNDIGDGVNDFYLKMRRLSDDATDNLYNFTRNNKISIDTNGDIYDDFKKTIEKFGNLHRMFHGPNTRKSSYEKLELINNSDLLAIVYNPELLKKIPEIQAVLTDDTMRDFLLNDFFPKYFSEIRKLFDILKAKFQDDIDKSPPLNKLPYWNKINAVAQKNGIDPMQAIFDTIRSPSKPINNVNQFLYRTAEALSHQYAKMHKTDWRAAWNKFLRELGYSGVADTRDSGHVHGGEKTQGVFLNPKDIILIKTIVQKTHSDQNDPASRPDARHWCQGSHERILDPQNQRQNPWYDSKRYKSPVDKSESTYLGMLKVINTLVSLMTYGDDPAKVLVPLIKLVKSYRTLSKQVSQSDYARAGYESAFRRLKNDVSTYHSSLKRDPTYAGKINVLLGLLDNQQSNLIYKKPFYK